MRPEARFSPDAQADVAYAVDYYNARRANLGNEFLDEVGNLTSLIRESPLLFTLVDPPIRRALLRRFPYGVFGPERPRGTRFSRPLDTGGTVRIFLPATVFGPRHPGTSRTAVSGGTESGEVVAPPCTLTCT